MALSEPHRENRVRASGVLSRAAQQWIGLAIGLVLAFAGLDQVRQRWMIDPQALAYGTETQPSFGDVDGRPVHCSGARGSALCVAAYEKSGRAPAILWLGNSQLAGINRPRAGDENAPQLLHRTLYSRGKYVVAYSQPNANLFEHAFAVAALAGIYHPKLVLLPVVFDDIREQGLRRDLAALVDDPQIAAQVRQWQVFPALAGLLATGPDSDGAKLATKDSIQATVEDRLTKAVERVWLLFGDRTRLRGTFNAAIHGFRNQLLAIHSTTKRTVDGRVLAGKLAVLDTLLGDLARRGIAALVYVPPYRSDIDGPYIDREYQAFKRQLAALAVADGARFADLEDVVPGPEWGTVRDRILSTDEPDFMHFTADGHKRLAAALDAELRRAGY